jgi:predicted CoA-binding protein
MPADLNHDDRAMRDVLQRARVIAVVGHSDDPTRTSYRIAQFLREAGYIVYPVNPTVSTIDGQVSYAALADVPEPIDIVNVFRRSAHLPGVVNEAISVKAGTVWAQLGVFDHDAGEKALRAGLNVAMNTCIKVEYLRLLG